MKFSVLVLPLIFFVACTATPKKLLQVGNTVITDIDCGQKELVDRVLYPNAEKLNGCDSLKKTYQFYEVAKKLDIDLSNTVIKHQEEQVLKKTDPKLTATIKKIFGPDQISYQKLFIVPQFIEQYLFSEVYRKNLNLKKGQGYNEWLKLQVESIPIQAF